MKRTICLILTLMLTFGLCACGSSEETAVKEDNGLKAGFSRVDVTPDYEVQLAGGAATRISDGAQDYLYVTCIALSAQGETFLLYTMDFICAEDVFVDPAKAFISSATGVPESNILMNATHTHASAAIRTNSSKNVDQYRNDFYAWATEAAEKAIADMSAATVSYGSVMTQNMAWVRHYELDNGTYAGSNFGSFSSGNIVGHSTEADNELQIIRLTRAAEDKKDIVLMNFPAHATMTQSNTALSADYPSPARMYVEENANVHCAFFIAAAGDQVPSSRIPEESFSTNHIVYGEELGRLTVEGLASMTAVEADRILFNEKTFTAGYNKENLDRLPDAMKVDAKWEEVGRGTDAGKAAAKEYGFSSVYEVSAILSRAKAPETNSMNIRVLALGDVSFIFAPYEMFGSTGMTIKENSPYPMTFVITCSEGAEGYLPTLKGWEIGSYESHVTKFERGTAEKLADEFVAMLTELKNS